MKKRLVCLLLALAALLLLSGCGSVFARDYYYEAPYTGDIGTRSDSATEIRNYNMLKTALLNMISSHSEKGEFRFSNYNGNVSEDLAAACFEIKSDNPLGAYAVETLSYDTSYVVSYYVANLYVSYKRTAEELERIVYAARTSDFADSVRAAVDHFAPELVIRCFSAEISEAEIRAILRRHVFDDPVAAAAEPEMEATRYPAEGANCIYALRFRYPYDAQRSEAMRAAVEQRLAELTAEMTETEAPQQALEAATRLSELCAGGDPEALFSETAYGALVRGNADSKGVALAYRALCTALGVDCAVVQGAFGSMGTEPHFWNIVTLEGDSYHVDVTAMADDPAAAFLLSDDALWGRYIWETADYPVCDGPLRYAEVAGLPEEDEEPEAPETPDQPQAPDAPEETPPESGAPEETPPPDAPPDQPGETAPPEETPGETPPPTPGEDGGSEKTA